MLSTAATTEGRVPTGPSLLDDVLSARPIDWNSLLTLREQVTAAAAKKAVDRTSSSGEEKTTSFSSTEAVVSSCGERKRSHCDVADDAPVLIGYSLPVVDEAASFAVLVPTSSSDQTQTQTPKTGFFEEAVNSAEKYCSQASTADEANVEQLDLHLLHMACDADPSSGTRALDVRHILRLANGIERSIIEGGLRSPSSAKRFRGAASTDASSFGQPFARQRPADPSSDLIARAPLFVDRLDGRTPLHRACAPPKDSTPSTEQEQFVASMASGVSELVAVLTDSAGAGETSDISDISGVDDDEDDEEGGPAPTRALAAGGRIARPKRDKNAPKEPGSAWLFETTCLLLGLCPSLVAVQDSAGETPLHLLARHRIAKIDALVAAAARSMLQFHPGLTRVKDKWGNTPLHRRVLTALDVFSPPARPIDAGPIIAAAASQPMGQLPVDSFASLLIASDPGALLVPNKSGLTPLHLACKYRRTARDPMVMYDLLREMALFQPASIWVPDEQMGFTSLHYLCETDANSQLIELLCEIEDRFRAATANGMLPRDAPPDEPKIEPKSSLLLQDKRGFTPLHLACLDRAPLPVLRSLLRRCPAAASIRETWGRTPLDVAWRAHSFHVSRIRDAMARFDDDGDFDAIRAAVEGDGAAASAGSTGHFWAKVLCLARAMTGRSDAESLPELHAIAGSAACPVEVVEVAVRVYPHQLRWRDAQGDLPVHSAARSAPREWWVPKDYARRWRQEERRRVESWLEDGHGDDDSDGDDGGDDGAVAVNEVDQEEESDDEATASVASGNDGEESVFSASAASSSSVRTPKPEPFAEYGTSSDEESVATAAEGDQLSPQSFGTPATMRSSQAEVESESSHSSGRHPPSCALELLLDVDPESALMADGSGRLPLHIALASKRTWSHGVRAIVSAGPAVAARRDPRTGLYPFMLAASAGRTCEEADRDAEAAARIAEEKAEEARGAEDEARAVSLRADPAAGPGGWVFSEAVLAATRAALAAEAARVDTQTKEREAQAELKGLNTVFILLNCRPELVGTGIPK